MSKKIVERYLKYFEPFYINTDFTRSKKLSSFYKNGFEVILGPSATHPGSITLRPRFRVTNFEIQNILEKVFPAEIGLCTFYRIQDMDFAFECGVQDENIIHSQFNLFATGSLFTGGNGGSYYYSIDEYTDLAPILEDHRYFMEKVTFPLFDKLSSLEGIDSFFNDRILTGDMEYFMSEKRQMFLNKVHQKREVLSGLIAAKLTNNLNISHLLFRYKSMWEGNNYILDDVDKLMLYFDEE